MSEPSTQISERTAAFGGEEYPESDGQLMADNTEQYERLVTLQANLDRLLPCFVAGDLLWYPVRGKPKIRVAPDVLVALGRPKGHRGSYRQWEEEDVAPQIVFEILSPGNTTAEMKAKIAFYQQYGVREYYILDPKTDSLEIWIRRGGLLFEKKFSRSHVSPLLGIRFVRAQGKLTVLDPQSRPFESFLELSRRADAEGQMKERALAQAEEERAEKERAITQVERERAEKEKERQEKEAALARAERERQEKEAALSREQALRAMLEKAGLLLE